MDGQARFFMAFTSDDPTVYDVAALLGICGAAIALPGLHFALLNFSTAAGHNRVNEAPGVGIVLSFSLLAVVGAAAPWFLQQIGPRPDAAVRISAWVVSIMLVLMVAIDVNRIRSDRIDFYYGTSAVMVGAGALLNLVALLAGWWGDPWRALLAGLALSLVVVLLQIVKSMLRIAQATSSGSP